MKLEEFKKHLETSKGVKIREEDVLESGKAMDLILNHRHGLTLHVKSFEKTISKLEIELVKAYDHPGGKDFIACLFDEIEKQIGFTMSQMPRTMFSKKMSKIILDFLDKISKGSLFICSDFYILAPANKMSEEDVKKGGIIEL